MDSVPAYHSDEIDFEVFPPHFFFNVDKSRIWNSLGVNLESLILGQHVLLTLR